MNLSADLAQLSHRTVRETEAQQSENSEPGNQSLMNHGVSQRAERDPSANQVGAKLRPKTGFLPIQCTLQDSKMLTGRAPASPTLIPLPL